MPQQELQRLVAGARLEEAQAVAAQQRLQRQEVLLQVVDDEKIDWFRHAVPSPTRKDAIASRDIDRASAFRARAAPGIIGA